MISMPLLNDVQAAGLTPMQLSASITEKLKKYIEDPRVTVAVTRMNSQKIYVTGEASHGGVMYRSKPKRGTPSVIRDLEDSPQGPIISVPR
jgi:protein involved in polysaccharide export with SLBB domain